MLLDNRDHFVVGFFGFLNLFSKSLLLDIIFANQFICVLYLRIYVTNSVSQSCFCLLPALVNQHPTYLLVYLCVFLNRKSTLWNELDLLKNEAVFALLFVETISSLNILLGFFLESIVFFYLFFDLILKSLEFHLGVHLFIFFINLITLIIWYNQSHYFYF